VECFFRYPFWSKYDTTISAISHREEDEDEGEDEDEDEEESPLSLLFCITISQSKGASYGSSTPVKPLILPARARLYKPFGSLASQTWSGTSINTYQENQEKVRLMLRLGFKFMNLEKPQ